jgi:hypothetical protein
MLGDHHCSEVRARTRYARHDRGVDDAQPRTPSTAVGVDDAEWLSAAPIRQLLVPCWASPTFRNAHASMAVSLSSVSMPAVEAPVPMNSAMSANPGRFASSIRRLIPSATQQIARVVEHVLFDDRLRQRICRGEADRAARKHSFT